MKTYKYIGIKHHECEGETWTENKQRQGDQRLLNRSAIEDC